MISKNQKLAEKAVKRIAYKCNQSLCKDLKIELKDFHYVGENSVAFDIKTKAVSEPEINAYQDNDKEIKTFINSIFEIFERVRVSQDWDVDDFQAFYRYHISCGIVKMGYREIPEIKEE